MNEVERLIQEELNDRQAWKRLGIAFLVSGIIHVSGAIIYVIIV